LIVDNKEVIAAQTLSLFHPSIGTLSAHLNREIMAVKTDEVHFWRSFSKALGAELRDVPEVTGASGLIHPLKALCVDEKTDRVILFSNESDPRVAALVQGDVQTTMPSTKVIVVRPTVYDLGAVVRAFYRDAQSAQFDYKEFKKLGDQFGKMDNEQKKQLLQDTTLGPGLAILGSILTAVKHVPLPALTHVGNLINQAALINWSEVLEAIKLGNADPTAIPKISLQKAYEYDGSAIDREYGVCPVPLYKFTTADWELFLAGRHIEEIQARLRALNILQYFFPPPDQVALGATERGITKRNEIIDIVSSAPSLGHPHGPNELIPTADAVLDVVEQLAEQRFITEVDHSVQITNSGTSARLQIKATPMEGVISKLINRFKFDFRVSTRDLKDIFK
jgi:hypothetical protein